MKIPAFAAMFAAVLASLPAADEATKDLLAPGFAETAARMIPNTPDLKVATGRNPEGIEITIQPGAEGYPGVNLAPDGGGVWDLSSFGHVEARVVNTGTAALSLALRVDARADWKLSPWNTENKTIKPGEAADLKVIFGYAYGFKPAFKVNPAEIEKLLLFAEKRSHKQSFRIETLQAAGPAGEKPPVDPKSVRVVPVNGVIFPGESAFDQAKQLDAKGGASAVAAGGAIKIDFVQGKTGQFVMIKPALGKWDLREALQVRVRLKNSGTATVTPRVVVSSNDGPADPVSEAIAPGDEREFSVSFVAKTPWQGIKDLNKTAWNGQPNTGTNFISDAVGSINIGQGPEPTAQSLLVTSIIADVPPAPEMPDWLGKKPPVEGDWVQTFSEEFETGALDESKWRMYTENYWDKRSHFSKDNVIIKDGKAILRYEKKTGFHNDDPKLKQTDYATGFLDTYGKWVQRYGYFEARMKLPTGPGLWPAFWLMPDRGEAEGPQWKRADTGRGAMEFDIMEFLSRWGPYRFNIAFHWDGYGKEHKQTGTTKIYFEPDKEGYVTSGLLWLPGLAVIYANGREVARLETPRISNVPSDIMFTHVSGGWDNNGIDDSTLPDDFVIDYVRAWQRKDLASPADGPVPSSSTPSPSARP
jgi:beta-glucanase (GH16 family)